MAAIENTRTLAEKAVKYLKAHYLQAQGYSTEEHGDWKFFILALKDGKGGTTAFTLKELEENQERLIEFIAARIEEHNLYHTIRAFKPDAEKPTNEAADEETRVIYLDLDGKGHREVPEAVFRKEAKPLLELLEEQRIDYGIIKSGTGWHIKIVLDEPITNDEVGRTRVLAEWLREYTTKIDLDTKIFNPARQIRLPWTVNQRNGKIAIPMSGAGVTRKTDWLSLIAEIEQERKKKMETTRAARKQELADGSARYDLDESQVEGFAKDLALVLQKYYKSGIRHDLMLMVSGTLVRHSILSTERLKGIIERLCEFLDDEEVQDRLTVLNDSLQKMEAYRKKESPLPPATTTVFFVEQDDEVIDPQGRLQSFADTNDLSQSEAVEVIKGIKKSILALLEKYGVCFDSSIVGRELLLQQGKKKKYLEVFNSFVAVSTYKAPETEEEGSKPMLLSRQYIMKANIELKSIKKVNGDDRMLMLYDLTFRFANGVKAEFKEDTIDQIADFLANSHFITAKTKADIKRYLQAIISILERANNIKVEEMDTAFKVKFIKKENEDDTVTVQIEHNAHRVVNDYFKQEARKWKEIPDEEVKLAMDIINGIEDDALLFLLAGASFSALFNEHFKLKPVLWIWGDYGKGKSTVAELFTTRLFGTEKLSADDQASAFRTIAPLTVGPLPLLIDDISRINPALADFLKSYVTGLDKTRRGRADLSIKKYELSASIIVTANNPFRYNIDDGAFKDRVLQYHISDFVFEDEEFADAIEELTPGVGLKMAATYRNSDPRELFCEYRVLIDELAEKSGILLAPRRKKIYTKLLLGLQVLFGATEEFGHEELHKRLIRIAQRLGDIIKQIEAAQDSVTEIELFVDELIRALRSHKLAVDEGDKTFVFKETIKAIRYEEPLFEAVSDLRQLEKAINNRYPGAARVGKFWVKSKRKTAHCLRIDLNRINEIKEAEIDEDGAGGLKNLLKKFFDERRNREAGAFLTNDLADELKAGGFGNIDEEKLDEVLKELAERRNDLLRKNKDLMGFVVFEPSYKHLNELVAELTSRLADIVE